MSPPSTPAPASNNAFDAILKRLSATRFATISLLLHAILVLMVGGTVLYKVASEPPDFEAGAEGILIESTEQAEPPGIPENQPVEEFKPQAPKLDAPLSALVTASTLTPTFAVASVPDAPTKGLSDTAKNAMASLGENMPKGGGMSGSAMSRLGGMRTAMIFGKKVEAAKLGVILDVSGSAHPHLAGAITEIQKGFADAILILYPGCGMVDFKGDSGYDIRKYSSISKKDLESSPLGSHTTPGQISKALKIPEFEKMTKRPSVKDTLYVAWYESSTSAGGMVGKTQVAFEELIKRGVDTIYWFADFADAVDEKAVDRLRSQLKNKNIKVHVHNFAGRAIKKEVVEMAEKSGGTVNTDKPK